MNLYLVSRTDSVGYDEFDSMVVAAETPSKAVRMKPASYYGKLSTPDNLKVKLVGTTTGKRPTVILASFNAG